MSIPGNANAINAPGNTHAGNTRPNKCQNRSHPAVNNNPIEETVNKLVRNEIAVIKQQILLEARMRVNVKVKGKFVVQVKFRLGLG